MGVSAPCAQGGQKGVSDPLELGFKTGVDHLVGAGSQFLSLARAPSAGAVSGRGQNIFNLPGLGVDWVWECREVK